MEVRYKLKTVPEAADDLLPYVPGVMKFRIDYSTKIITVWLDRNPEGFEQEVRNETLGQVVLERLENETHEPHGDSKGDSPPTQ